jgi:hypothetical protein
LEPQAERWGHALRLLELTLAEGPIPEDCDARDIRQRLEKLQAFGDESRVDRERARYIPAWAPIALDPPDSCRIVGITGHHNRDRAGCLRRRAQGRLVGNHNYVNPEPD